MNNIIDTIRVSGTDYVLSATSSGGADVVEITQNDYDNLPESAKTEDILYVISDAEAGDLSQYWTSAQTNSAITEATSGKAETSYVDSAVSGKANSSDVYTKSETSGATEIATALSGKQDTLSAGTGISIVDNVISATGGGGGGKAIEAGRGIAVTTGATADTVSFNLPISAGTGNNSIRIGNFGTSDSESSVSVGYRNTASGQGAFAQGGNTYAHALFAHTEGTNTNAGGEYSHAEGYYTTANTSCSHTEGRYTKTSNRSEHAEGEYNVSNKANDTFGDSGNTLFSIGNGTANNARHNAFEIRQNGDIYLSSGGTDILLQDHLGGSSINVVQTTGSSTTDVMSQAAVTSAIPTVINTITSGSTDAITSGAVYDALGDIETLLSNI